MKILWLCDKRIYQSKMSRVRFHSVDAIARHPEVELTRDGPGWGAFSTVKDSIQRNEPDFVMWYQPMDLQGYEEAQETGVPLILRYNEMHNIDGVRDEIRKTGSSIIICHLSNYINEFRRMFPSGIKFHHVPHCAEQMIFKPMDIEKRCDIMLIGHTDEHIYPLRYKFKQMIYRKMFDGYRTRILNHPGYTIKDVNDQVLHYAAKLNQAKIVLSDSSKYGYALAKFVEAGMCGTCIFSDIPAERGKWYRQWVVEVRLSDDEKRIAGKIRKFLDTGMWKEWGARGRELCYSEYTQEHYAQRFVDILKGVKSGEV